MPVSDYERGRLDGLKQSEDWRKLHDLLAAAVGFPKADGPDLVDVVVRARSDADLLLWVVRHDHRGYRGHSRAHSIMHVMGLGMTSAVALCRRAGADPDEVMR